LVPFNTRVFEVRKGRVDLSCHDSREIKALTAGIWLIGLGVMLATRLWLSGILILFGITMIVRGVAENQGTTKIERGLWAIIIGVCMALRFNLAFLLVAAGVFLIVRSMSKPAEIGKKPHLDNWLE
jgi:hypothetical protein